MLPFKTALLPVINVAACVVATGLRVRKLRGKLSTLGAAIVVSKNGSKIVNRVAFQEGEVECQRMASSCGIQVAGGVVSTAIGNIDAKGLILAPLEISETRVAPLVDASV